MFLLKDSDRPSVTETGANLKWYPLARVVRPLMKTKGKYLGGYPKGAIVHFTAGRDEDEKSALGSLNWGRESGYCFLVIGPTGIVYQSHPIDEWGSHAGESYWPGLGSGVSSKLIGIEICCAGGLDAKNTSWFGKTYPESEVRSVTEATFGCPTGKYKKYTEAQEAALIQLLLWLKSNNPNAFNFELVLGHHEASGKKRHRSLAQK